MSIEMVDGEIVEYALKRDDTYSLDQLEEKGVTPLKDFSGAKVYFGGGEIWEKGDQRFLLDKLDEGLYRAGFMYVSGSESGKEA